MKQLPKSKKPRVSQSGQPLLVPKQDTPRHILIKLTKIKHKEQILKAAREKQENTQGDPLQARGNGRTHLK